MPRATDQIKMRFKIILVLSSALLLLSACSSKKSTEAPTPTETLTPTFTITDQPLVAESSATPTLLPAITDTSAGQSVGVITFSMGEAGFQHLFAYHPNFLPITRLTSGQWDDIDPVISPAGDKLVFSSDRSGTWDLYLWDLTANVVQQLTNSSEVETDPDWSPDNQWVTYTSYSNGQSNIIIRSVTDPDSAPIQLTDGSGGNYDPAWSPLGRQIAFSTNRSGRSEIWLVNLDSAENRFSVAAGGEDADFIRPVWSPDGSSLAWERKAEESFIELMQLSGENTAVISIGSGESPFWSPDGKTLLASVNTPNQSFLTGYAVSNGVAVYPLISVPALPSSFHWAGVNSFQKIIAILSTTEVTSWQNPCQTTSQIFTNANNRFSLVDIPAVTAPNPMLSDTTDDCFASLRSIIASRLGWDLLATLENAALPITSPPDPGIPENWLYTGRAIALNIASLQAGWMVVSRENYQGKVYWRVWAKCLQQNGSCGFPLSKPVWDFSSRASGNLAAFEAGGKLVPPPSGFWVDITDISSQFGWQRLPSLNNWRSYYPGILFNTLVFRQGLSWRQAMLQLYPEDVITIVAPGK